jgi:hypothetical protein
LFKVILCQDVLGFAIYLCSTQDQRKEISIIHLSEWELKESFVLVIGKGEINNNNEFFYSTWKDLLIMAIKSIFVMFFWDLVIKFIPFSRVKEKRLKFLKKKYWVTPNHKLSKRQRNYIDKFNFYWNNVYTVGSIHMPAIFSIINLTILVNSSKFIRLSLFRSIFRKAF